ncbi:hypothetical protein [Streptomyces virginiae]|uniref:hypothetical protein n=1 Tax=Streptomyces virginiae TaxID=1961 RepID=UPI00343A7159
MPLIAVHDAAVNVARSTPPPPRDADRSLAPGSLGAVAQASPRVEPTDAKGPTAIQAVVRAYDVR